MISICSTVVLLLQSCFNCSMCPTPQKPCSTVDCHYFFSGVLLTKIVMHIQPADRLRLLGRILQLQNDRFMQNVAVHLDLACRIRFKHLGQCWVRNWILERPLFGQYEVLMDQLLNPDING